MSPGLRDLFGKPRKPPVERPASPTPALRDTLFGDRPMDQWPVGDESPGEPWTSFIGARGALKQGDVSRAVHLWKNVAATPGLEPRHYLQAWTFLRGQGEQPPADQTKTVYGVVAEVSMPQGLDLLAAYPDYSARYYNFSGSGVVWDHPSAQLNPQIDRLLDAGRAVVDLIGLWTEPRPGPPPVNQARFSILTPGGLYFGQGAMQALSADPKGKGLVDSATDLMLHMTQLKTG